MKETINNNQKGITLIALVITVIILLILAGVAISMLSGENGILNKAANAKTSTDVGKLSESIKLAATTVMTSKEHKLTKEEFQKELEAYGYKINEEDGTVTMNGQKYAVTSKGAIELSLDELKKEQAIVYTNTKIEDKNGYQITIPMNFNISSDSPVLVTEGIVIEDNEDNQYVWIPLFEKTDERTWGVDYSAVASEDDWSNIEQVLINTTNGYTKAYRQNGYSDVWYGDANYGKYGYYSENDTEKTNLIYYTNGNMSKTKYETLYHNMLKSVYKNGGFYIGRYEMGKALVNSTTEARTKSRTSASKEYIVTSTNENNQAPTIEDMTKPISKANAVPYNYITQSQAQMLSESLNYSSVTSSLMFGVQWDMVCVFIEHYDTNNTAPTKSQWLTNNTYSKLWGNYLHSEFVLNRGFYTTTYSSTIVTWVEDYNTQKGATDKWLCTTGASNQNISLNIYDFSGNVLEWTLERSIDSIAPCVLRGGCFDDNDNVSVRYNLWEYDRDFYDSARLSFYIN